MNEKQAEACAQAVKILEALGMTEHVTVHVKPWGLGCYAAEILEDAGVRVVREPLPQREAAATPA